MKKKTFIIFILPVIALVGGYLLREVFATSNPHDWSSGLVGYWSFDGQYTTTTSGVDAGTKDVSNNGNWGTFNGGVKPTAGVSGQALSFDGVDDDVDMGNPTILKDLTLADFTVEAWFYLTANQIAWAGIYVKSDRPFLGADNVGDNLNFGITVTGGIYSSITDPNPLSNYFGKWTQVVGTQTGTNLTLYVNGVEVVGPTEKTGTRITNNGVARFGFQGGASRYFNGLIDEVRIYNRALSADEIKQHYDQTRRNVRIDPTQSYKLRVATSVPSDWWTSGLVGYWPFDGQYTTTTSGVDAGTKDISGNNSWGTFNNGVKPVSGIVGQALSFDGVNDYVNIDDPASGVLDFGTKAFSVEYWIKISTALGGNSYQYPLYKGGDGALNAGYSFYTREANADFVFAISDGDNVATPSYAIAVSTGANKDIRDNNWHHIVGVRNASDSKLYLYIDGALNQSIAYSEVNIDTTKALSIGARVAGTPINGLMDEVRIYNRALGADEVKQHYEQSRRNLRL